jgi:hypothetical protein
MSFEVRDLEICRVVRTVLCTVCNNALYPGAEAVTVPPLLPLATRLA